MLKDCQVCRIDSSSFKLMYKKSLLCSPCKYFGDCNSLFSISPLTIGYTLNHGLPLRCPNISLCLSHLMQLGHFHSHLFLESGWKRKVVSRLSEYKTVTGTKYFLLIFRFIVIWMCGRAGRSLWLDDSYWSYYCLKKIHTQLWFL